MSFKKLDICVRNNLLLEYNLFECNSTVADLWSDLHICKYFVKKNVDFSYADMITNTFRRKDKNEIKKNLGLYTVKSNIDDKNTTFLHTAVKWCNDLPRPKRHSIGKFVILFFDEDLHRNIGSCLKC